MSPLTHGSVSFRRFGVGGEPPRDWRRSFDLALRRHAFRPIAVERGEARSAGWVNPRQVLDADVSVEKLLLGRWLLLALRHDRIALNARLFRARLDLALVEAAAKAKKTRLSRAERQAVEDQVRLEMLRSQTPSTQIIEGAWRMDEGVVYVATVSESGVLVFSELFAATFGLTLTPAMAAVRAVEWARKNGLEDRLVHLTPSVFAPRGVATAAPEAQTGVESDDGDA